MIITYWAAVGVDSDKLRFRATNTGCRMGTIEIQYGANAVCGWKQPKGRGADRMKTSGSSAEEVLVLRRDFRIFSMVHDHCNRENYQLESLHAIIPNFS